jgi:hypothetical protein
MRTISEPDGRRFIGFETSYLANLAREVLDEEPFHFGKYHERVLASDLGFSRSEEVADSAIQLIREGMVYNSDQASTRWLLEWIRQVSVRLEILKQVDFEGQVFQYQRLLEVEKGPRIIEGWSKLLAFMLQNERLAPVARDCLATLIDEGWLGLAIELVDGLRESPDFDPLIWIKRLAELDPAVFPGRTPFDLLRDYLYTHRYKRPELFGSLRDLCSYPRECDSLTQLHKTAIDAVLTVCIDELFDKSFDAAQQPKVLFPVFGEDSLAGPAFESVLALIHHPCAETVLIDLQLVSWVAELLSGGILVPVQVPVDDEEGRGTCIETQEWPIVSFLFIEQVLEEEVSEGFFALLLLAWTWLLLIAMPECEVREFGKHRFARLFDSVAALPRSSRISLTSDLVSRIFRRVRVVRRSLPRNEYYIREHLHRLETCAMALSDGLFYGTQRKGAVAQSSRDNE